MAQRKQEGKREDKGRRKKTPTAAATPSEDGAQPASAQDKDGAGAGREQQLSAELRELQERHETALRQAADAQNAMRELQDRVSREQERIRQYAAEAIASGLLPVLDDLERALEGLQQAEEADSAFTDGLELIVRNWLEVFGRFHIERLAPERGEAFDPHRHEAMSTVTQAGAAPNTVWETVQPGYLLHGRVLRPARVVVTQQAAPAGAPAADKEPPAADKEPPAAPEAD